VDVDFVTVVVTVELCVLVLVVDNNIDVVEVSAVVYRTSVIVVTVELCVLENEVDGRIGVAVVVENGRSVLVVLVTVAPCVPGMVVDRKTEVVGVDVAAVVVKPMLLVVVEDIARVQNGQEPHLNQVHVRCCCPLG